MNSSSYSRGRDGARESSMRRYQFQINNEFSPTDLEYSQDLFGGADEGDNIFSQDIGEGNADETQEVSLRSRDVMLAANVRRLLTAPLTAESSLGPVYVNEPMQLDAVGQLGLGIRINDSDLDVSPSFFRLGDSDGASQTQDLVSTPLYELSTINGQCVGGMQTIAVPLSSFLQQGHNLDNGDVKPSGNFLVHQICPEQETVTLENWPGQYNFKVVPAPDSLNCKRCVYAEQGNKLFCKDSVAVPFHVKMDYSMTQDPSQFTLRASLVFESPDEINKPVTRCVTHLQKESGITDNDKVDRLQHVLRPSQPHADTQYVVNETSKRCYLLSPLKFPEPGVDFVARSYVFTCLSSCDGGIGRRPLSLMFCLYDQTGTLVGRNLIHLRVCSAPLRDCKKEFGDVVAGTGKESRKRKSVTKEATDEDRCPPKRNAVELDDGASAPGFHVVGTSVRCVITGAATGRSEDDLVSSSQETVYSCDESEQRIQLRNLVKDVRWALKLKKSDNIALQDYSKNIYNSLKQTQELCNSARRIYENFREKEDGKSPDGGFHEAGQD